MNEIKQTNFRLNQDTADAFRHFCEENGMNHAQGFDHIMQIVELDKAKNMTPARETEIESFEKAIKEIMSAYLNSIELSNDTEARVREHFASTLNRNEKIIDELQQKIEHLQNENKTLINEKITATTAQKAAEEHERNAIAQMDAARKAVADQERINSMLTVQLADANECLAGYNKLKTTEQELREQLEGATRNIADLQKAHENELKQAHTAAELDKERAVMAKERELYDQIRQVDRENARLQAHIEQLTAQLHATTPDQD